jgi:A/G-specific adenine glycosylase
LRDAEAAMVEIGRPLRGRDRLLALMDVGATICRAREPVCGECPLRRRCRTRGPLPSPSRRSAPFAGSFRQRRGVVLAALRAAGGCGVTVGALDGDALDSLVADGLAAVAGGRATLPGA